MEIFVGAELAVEAEIGIFQENAGVEEAGAADGELVERGPAAGRRDGGGGEEIGDDGGNGGGAFVSPADGAEERGESGADAGQPSPVSWVVFQLEEDGQDHIFRQFSEHAFLAHCFMSFSLRWVLRFCNRRGKEKHKQRDGL